jgi:D-arabinose 5-phosphate isomerase GutQ
MLERNSITVGTGPNSNLANVAANVVKTKKETTKAKDTMKHDTMKMSSVLKN